MSTPLGLRVGSWLREDYPDLIPLQDRQILRELATNERIINALARGITEIEANSITYNVKQRKKYRWSDPEESVNDFVISFPVLEKGYPTTRIKTEVKPRGVPSMVGNGE